MKVYIRTAEVPDKPGERPIMYVAWDHQVPGLDTSPPKFAPHIVRHIDEEIAGNAALCDDLAATLGQTDVFKLGKYYVAGTDLFARGSWVPRPKTYVPTADIVKTPAVNPEKSALAGQFATAIARLQQIQASAVGSTLAQTQAAVRDMAQIEEAMLKRLAQAP